MDKSGEHFPVKDRLHTDILEQRYGPIHAVVLRHDNVHEVRKGTERIREVRLVDENNILRTYALTFLTYDRNNSELSGIDNKIRAGGLIGKIFREHGYAVKKNVIDVFIIEIPVWMQKDFGVDCEKAKARLTEFFAKKSDETPVIYGTVLEIYSPDFKNPDDGVNEVDTTQINPLIGTLQGVGVPTDEIWERLDRASEDNEWSDLEDRYKQAQKMSFPVIESLHNKISDYLSKKYI